MVRKDSFEAENLFLPRVFSRSTKGPRTNNSRLLMGSVEYRPTGCRRHLLSLAKVGKMHNTVYETFSRTSFLFLAQSNTWADSHGLVVNTPLLFLSNLLLSQDISCSLLKKLLNVREIWILHYLTSSISRKTMDSQRSPRGLDIVTLRVRSYERRHVVSEVSP